MIGPKLAELITARDDAAAEVAGVQARIAGLQGQVEALREEADSLGAKITEAVASGDNPAKLRAKRKATEARADETTEWIADLQGHLAGLLSVGNEAELNLFNRWMEVQAEYFEQAQAALDGHLRQLSIDILSYNRGMMAAYTQLLRPGEFPPEFNLTAQQVQSRRACIGLKLYSRRSILGLQERYAHLTKGALLG